MQGSKLRCMPASEWEKYSQRNFCNQRKMLISAAEFGLVGGIAGDN